MKRMRAILSAGGLAVAVSLAGAAVLTGCSGPGKAQATAAPRAESVRPAQLFDGMGAHRRKVTTTSAEAQRYFDQGLTWSYAFNHDEAIRSFKRAAELDPGCAMAWWGVSLCNGPHINNPAMDEARSREAWDAVQKAVSLSAGGTPQEKALIGALTHRYAAEAPKDRAPLDAAYAAAMRGVWDQFPSDDDIGTLFAESMMDLRPWDLWKKDGTPQPGTEEIVLTLERVLAMNPKNPGANHLYIHTMEASPQPQKAMAAADRLRTMVPAAGHLVHMPAHIDVRVGNWEQASVANERAIAADAKYRKLSPRQGFYRLYMAHNHHFLAFASMMEGRREAAMRAADEMIAGVPDEALAHSPAMLDPYMSIRYDVMKRFGMWDEMLAEPAPPTVLPITTAMWRYTRAVAFAAKHDVRQAREEQQRFNDAVRAVPKDALMAINPAHTVLDIAARSLEAEIDIAEGRSEEAITELKQAVVIEDGLRYMEPPDWIQPVRHTLGAVLVSQQRYSEAEAVYREDLRIWPDNAWSLLGLKQCAEAQGRAAEVAALSPRVQRAWARADIHPGTTCLCVPAAK
ncbi:MAG: hypothetical protein IT436_18735 [Phycisphaerales bacterium]|nr:hypothetical protein [Phycisphaerales bacterium]